MSRKLLGRFVDIRLSETSLPVGKCKVIVPKKVARKAVNRNQLRRRVKEALRTHTKALSCYDITVIAKSASMKVKFLDIKNEIDDLLRI